MMVSHPQIRQKNILIGGATNTEHLLADAQFVLDNQTLASAGDMSNTYIHAMALPVEKH